MNNEWFVGYLCYSKYETDLILSCISQSVPANLPFLEIYNNPYLFMKTLIHIAI